MARNPLTTGAPESFVVRIYRRDRRVHTRIAGTVEVVACGSELAFANLRELRAILTTASAPAIAVGAALTAAHEAGKGRSR